MENSTFTYQYSATRNSEIERIEKKLNNPGFVAKAPEDVIAKEKEKLAQYEDSKAALVSRLASYQA